MSEASDITVLTGKLEQLQDAFLKGGYYNRLVMTDDITNLKAIYTKANVEKDEFYHGIALPDTMQDGIDDIVRSHKKLLNAMIKDQSVDTLGLSAVWCDVQNAFLIKFVSCGMGFYLAVRNTRPRTERKKSSLAELKKTLKAKGPIVLGRDNKR